MTASTAKIRETANSRGIEVKILKNYFSKFSNCGNRGELNQAAIAVAHTLSGEIGSGKGICFLQLARKKLQIALSNCAEHSIIPQ